MSQFSEIILTTPPKSLTGTSVDWVLVCCIVGWIYNILKTLLKLDREHPCCCPEFNPCLCVDPDPSQNEETEVQAIAIVQEPSASHEPEHQSQIVVDNNKQPAPEPEISLEPPPPYMPAALAAPTAPPAQAEIVHHM